MLENTELKYRNKKRKNSVCFFLHRGLRFLLLPLFFSHIHTSCIISYNQTCTQSHSVWCVEGIFPSWKTSSRERDEWWKCEMRIEENKMSECVTVTTWCTHTVHTNEHPQLRKCKWKERNKYSNSMWDGDVIVPLNNLTSWNESNIKWVGSVVDIAISGIMCVRRRWIYIESKRGDWKCTDWNRSISGCVFIVSIIMWYWLFHIVYGCVVCLIVREYYVIVFVRKNHVKIDSMMRTCTSVT